MDKNYFNKICGELNETDISEISDKNDSKKTHFVSYFQKSKNTKTNIINTIK